MPWIDRRPGEWARPFTTTGNWLQPKETLSGIGVATLEPEEIDYIHESYFGLARDGAGTAEVRDGLTRLAHDLCRRSALEAIVLAGTDFSVLFDESNTEFPHVDCARVHIEAILRCLQA